MFLELKPQIHFCDILSLRLGNKTVVFVAIHRFSIPLLLFTYFILNIMFYFEQIFIKKSSKVVFIMLSFQQKYLKYFYIIVNIP